MFAKVEPEPIDPALLESFPDGELIRLVKRGDDTALGELLRRHRDSLYRFCLHLMANRDDAEDICQESMARAITRVDSLQTGTAFRSWLFSIARNLSVDSYRSRRRLTALPDEDAGPLPLPLIDDSPYERVETHEECQTVTQAMSKLKKNHQTVLMLREVEGLSYAEIATRLELSQSAVETLLFRARRRLREEYTRSTFPIPGFAWLGSLRILAMRLASPFSGGPLVAKIAVSALVVGGAVAGTPRLLPVLHAGAQGIGIIADSPAAIHFSHHPAGASPSSTGTRGAANTATRHMSSSHSATGTASSTLLAHRSGSSGHRPGAAGRASVPSGASLPAVSGRRSSGRNRGNAPVRSAVVTVVAARGHSTGTTQTPAAHHTGTTPHSSIVGHGSGNPTTTGGHHGTAPTAAVALTAARTTATPRAGAHSGGHHIGTAPAPAPTAGIASRVTVVPTPSHSAITAHGVPTVGVGAQATVTAIASGVGTVVAVGSGSLAAPTALPTVRVSPVAAPTVHVPPVAVPTAHAPPVHASPLPTPTVHVPPVPHPTVHVPPLPTPTIHLPLP